MPVRPEPTVAMPEIDVDHPRCPFCHEEVRPADADKLACGDCMAWHHQECWTSHGGCSICQGRRAGSSGRTAASSGKGASPGVSRRFVWVAAGFLLLLGVGLASAWRARPAPAAAGSHWHTEFMATADEAVKTRWCRVGAEAGDPAAMNLLGYRLAQGIGCRQDSVEAVKWGRRSAELGHSNAMLGLALMLEGGHGVERDEEEAVSWLRRAVEAGDPQAPHHLELLLRRRPDLR